MLFVPITIASQSRLIFHHRLQHLKPVRNDVQRRGGWLPDAPHDEDARAVRRHRVLESPQVQVLSLGEEFRVSERLLRRAAGLRAALDISLTEFKLTLTQSKK